jgi:hypothetical protein
MKKRSAGDILEAVAAVTPLDEVPVCALERYRDLAHSFRFSVPSRVEGVAWRDVPESFRQD